jgi:hypothetical protein
MFKSRTILKMKFGLEKAVSFYQWKNQSSTTKDFNRAVKDIRPRTDGDYISVREWWKAINLLADDYGWSLRMRVTFMRRTGGLAPKLNDDMVRRVKDLMDHPESWVRSASSFEASKPASNQRYWLYMGGCGIEVDLRVSPNSTGGRGRKTIGGVNGRRLIQNLQPRGRPAKFSIP